MKCTFNYDSTTSPISKIILNDFLFKTFCKGFCKLNNKTSEL